MGRKKEFDREEVLDRAIEAFWCKGYEATSVQDLLDEMGINRGSLYDTFGDKHSLFLAAIDRYHEKALEQTRASLQQPGSPLGAIERTVRDMADCATLDRRRRGCLMTNSAVELAPHCAETARRVARYYRRTEEAFEEAILRAQDAHEIACEHPARSLARFLTRSIQGLLVVSKVDPDCEAMRETAGVILSTLSRPKQQIVS